MHLWVTFYNEKILKLAELKMLPNISLLLFTGIKSLKKYLVHMIGDSKFCQHLLNKAYLYLLFASCTLIWMASKICIKNCKTYKNLWMRGINGNIPMCFEMILKGLLLCCNWVFLTIFLEIIHRLFLAICASFIK